MTINWRLWANILAIIFSLTLILQNWQSVIVVNFLGTRTAPLPLGLTLLIAILVGAIAAFAALNFQPPSFRN